MVLRAECQVDLDAISANVATLARFAPSADLLAVVKADGYGHGLIPVARAAIEGGASWLGVALLEEAVVLRRAGIGVPILAWLWAPEDGDLVACVSNDIDVTASSLWQLEAIAAATNAAGVRARVQLKVDTGLARNGAMPDQWPELVARAKFLQSDGHIVVTGVWSHFSIADAPTSPANTSALEVFRAALEVVDAQGLAPEVRHIANSAATLALPDGHFDLVRPGIAMYGISPGGDLGPPAQYGLIPAMTLRARLASVKRVGAGQGVSYGHEYVTSAPTTLGLVPLGYADGIPRAAGGVGPVFAAGEVRRIAGRVCMDQFVLDLGDQPARPGDEVVLFGRSDQGFPDVQAWAGAVGTIGYEIVTRIGPRVPRTFSGGAAG